MPQKETDVDAAGTVKTAAGAEAGTATTTADPSQAESTLPSAPLRAGEALPLPARPPQVTPILPYKTLSRSKRHGRYADDGGTWHVEHGLWTPPPLEQQDFYVC